MVLHHLHLCLHAHCGIRPKILLYMNESSHFKTQVMLNVSCPTIYLLEIVWILFNCILGLLMYAITLCALLFVENNHWKQFPGPSSPLAKEKFAYTTNWLIFKNIKIFEEIKYLQWQSTKCKRAKPKTL